MFCDLVFHGQIGLAVPQPLSVKGICSCTKIAGFFTIPCNLKQQISDVSNMDSYKVLEDIDTF